MNIIMYTKTGCPWCDSARAFLGEHSIPFEEREVRSNPAYFEELVAKSGQDKTPTLDIDGFILADSDKDQIEAFLKKRGTPAA